MRAKMKVLAVIVTYNRRDDLQHCISSLRKQTLQDFDILVVNNGSTDGTKEYLDDEQGLIVIHQENLGGAGGFYAGQKYAMDHGYEWVWMMDDDGIPAPDQLESLVAFASKTGRKFLNALVLDKDDHSRLSFYAGDWTVDKAKSVELITDFIHPFNGTFIHREVMEKAGLVKREMFIWGDEIELTMRYGKAGYEPCTVTHAIHYHPKEKGTTDVVLPGLLRREIMVKPKKLSKYYYRNLGYIHQVYYRPRWYKGLKPMVMYTLYYLRKLDFAEAIKVVRYYRRGLHNDYTD